MIFTTEKLKHNLKSIETLSVLHYKEVAPYDDIPLNVNWQELLNLEDMGYLKLYCISTDDNKLVGYASFIVSPSIEYSSSLQASLNNIFIHPNYRGRGGQFISYCDNQLENLGVQVVYHHVKAKNDYGSLLKRNGYDIMNIEYSKRLDKG